MQPFAAAMSQAMLLPAFIALLGVVAALFLLGFANAPVAAPRRADAPHDAGDPDTTGTTGNSSTTTSTSSTSCTGTTPNRARPRLRGLLRRPSRHRHARPGQRAGTRASAPGMAQHPRSADGGTDDAPGVDRCTRTTGFRSTPPKPAGRVSPAPAIGTRRKRTESVGGVHERGQPLVGLCSAATVSAPIAFSRTRGLSTGNSGTGHAAR